MCYNFSKGVRILNRISQKRRHIRVGTNLVAKVTTDNKPIDKIVYIKDVSAIGAQIESNHNFANIGDILNIKFRFKNVTYSLTCKVVRTTPENNSCGIQFYFSDEQNTDSKIPNSKHKLYTDVLNEYFLYTDCFA